MDLPMLRSAITAGVGLIVLCSVSAVYGQETSEGNHKPLVESTQQPAEESKLPEIEFVASPSFRSGSVIQNLWGRVSFEGDYFGGSENNIGYTSGTWSFSGEHWKLAPGLGVNFGDNGYRTMPAASLRWEYEHEWFVTEGLLVQGFLRTKSRPEESEDFHEVAPFISDGNHISARWHRVTASWREGTEYAEPSDWVFASPMSFGKLPYWPDMLLRRHILSAAKRLGIQKRIGWHTFRRTAATLLMASGSSVKTTQELMRHATADITLELYAQAVPEDKREAQNTLAALIMGTQTANVQPDVSA